MNIKQYKSGILALLFLAAGAAQANAATITHFETAFNTDGTVVYDGSVYDLAGPTTINKTIGGMGSHSFIAYFDFEIDELLNPFANEYGATGGSLAAGQSWEIDEPGLSTGSYLGDIYDNMSAGVLDNTIMDGTFTGPEDVAVALGWDFTLAAGETAYITLTIADVAPLSGFYLEQSDPDSQVSVYYSSALTIRDGGQPVPEPTTMLLMGTGLVGLYGARRKKK